MEVMFLRWSQGISGYKNICSARQRKYVIRKVKDEEIMKKYKKEVKKGLVKGIGEINEQQNKQNEETG